MRTFINLEIPKKIKKDLEKIQKELAKAELRAKWVKPKNSHLTLVFLGKTDPKRIESITQILRKASQEIKPIKLHFLKIDGFPSLKKAKVIFISLGGELGKLYALSLKTRKELKKEKISFDEKPFRAHLTLGRLKKPQNLTEVIKKVKIEQVSFITNQISLTQSQLTPTGPFHTNLKTALIAK